MRRADAGATRPARRRPRPGTSTKVGLPVGLVAGVIVALVVAHYSGAFALLAGWLTGALVVNAWTWALVWRLDAAGTRAHVQEDDPGRRLAGLIVVLCSIASLGAVGYLLLQRAASPRLVVIQAVLCVVSVVMAWVTVHTMFTLRYAHFYYSDPEGGFDFHQREPPQYSDFAYVAFTVGMSYAISDTDVGKAEIRRNALVHALISYLLGAVVIGATINLLVSLPSGAVGGH
ncbi:MAG: DUF1345 domain-containing protein [Candidatus Dormibacteraeota bacterium]|nr:DUF1345 domain-containing protein [Candidatus Dormibacteraeota bacterium]